MLSIISQNSLWHLRVTLSNHYIIHETAYSISQEICTRFYALLCFVVVIHWLIFPYPSGLLHWHCGNLTIAPVPAKQPWWIWINTSCKFIMNDCVTTTKQSTTKPCIFLGIYCNSRNRIGTDRNRQVFIIYITNDIWNFIFNDNTMVSQYILCDKPVPRYSLWFDWLINSDAGPGPSAEGNFAVDILHIYLL